MYSTLVVITEGDGTQDKFSRELGMLIAIENFVALDISVLLILDIHVHAWHPSIGCAFVCESTQMFMLGSVYRSSFVQNESVSMCKRACTCRERFDDDELLFPASLQKEGTCYVVDCCTRPSHLGLIEDNPELVARLSTSDKDIF